ncbi:MAG: hypothetical protein QM722_17195 [Piscinibacter sp.]
MPTLKGLTVELQSPTTYASFGVDPQRLRSIVLSVCMPRGKARASDLPAYNAKVLAEERLPMVFLVHDEFADWMLDDAN